ncbi:2Fe-2S iron-sulfur cluster-binding protein [Botrimarina sp.]|uniref:2Fe-2S iron-sulfur cluster-binding protein n=1 Tax=Botrimarina sp. TaxID=2795802 RepID=UPI0032EE2477
MPAPGDPLLFYTGAALCLAVVGQATLGLVGLLRARAQRRQRSDADAAAFRTEAAAAAESARARLARRVAWEGRRPLRVSAVVDESPGVKSIYLTDPAGNPLPRFLPGQYLTVALPAGEGGAEVVRCYSFSDRPRPEYYRVSVRRQDAPSDPPGAPAGAASTWLHANAREGLALLCEAPRGAFFYNPAQPRAAVLVGAGVGVTPLVAMLEAIHHARLDTPTHAFFGFRDGASRLWPDRLREIAEADPRVSVHVSLSRPAPGDKLGEDYHAAGRLSVETLRRALPSSNYEFFLCGPGRMMQSMAIDLLEWGVPDTAIHFEAFGPASVSLEAGAILQKALGSPVRFAADAPPLVWDGKHATLLDLAEATGVPIAAGCRAGNCGACRVRVVQGKVAVLRKAGATTADGECLACISLPDGPVLLEA